MKLNSIEEIIDDIRQGKMVILMDDEDRENEGDLIIAAEQVRPEDVNFMATHARGLICLTLTEDRCKQLELPLMVSENGARHSTNFTVSIEAAEGVTTGISAADRAKTVRTAISRDARAKDIVQPGHIFPILSQAGGVLSRAGHTEAGCDLARLAGYEPSAVIVEIMNEDGTMARRPDLEKFAEKHNIKIGTISDLIQYRSVKEKTVERINERDITTDFGDFQLLTYRDIPRKELHYAFVTGSVNTNKPVLVRVHVLDAAKDILTLHKPEEQHYKSWNFHSALKHVQSEGSGVVVLICHSDIASTIEESVDWMLSGKQARPSQDMVYRQVGTGAQILQDLGVTKMRLMSAPFKFTGISGFDLEVVEQITNPK
ncbi:MAG: bifunctional 3,4-dihydroxy-2-butanone-4-phosphate synthase/GTP cyclohydrolase II [Cellvibrionaceae bacterium]